MKLGFYTDLFRTGQNTSHPELQPEKGRDKNRTNENSLRKVLPRQRMLRSPTIPCRNSLRPARSMFCSWGHFRKRRRRRRWLAELQNAGYTAYTDTITVPGKGTLIRVRLGSFSDVSEARKKAAEIQGKTKIPVLISKK